MTAWTGEGPFGVSALGTSRHVTPRVCGFAEGTLEGQHIPSSNHLTPWSAKQDKVTRAMAGPRTWEELGGACVRSFSRAPNAYEKCENKAEGF